jgi:hypothetical protein
LPRTSIALPSRTVVIIAQVSGQSCGQALKILCSVMSLSLSESKR